MEDRRIIKKYPNRRLYDTEDSKYIALKDIRRLVIENKEFIVKDVKTQKDLTRNILLQIIIEQEDNNEPFFSVQALTHIIRFCEDSVQSIEGDYLQQNINQFFSQQKNSQQHMETTTTENKISDD